MNLRQACHDIVRAANDATGNTLSATQTNFFGCLMAVLLAMLPTIIPAIVKCLTAPTDDGGSPDSYSPGDRTRC